jgi:hypothetical protein
MYNVRILRKKRDLSTMHDFDKYCLSVYRLGCSAKFGALPLELPDQNNPTKTTQNGRLKK